jgi:hypothetical protein
MDYMGELGRTSAYKFITASKRISYIRLKLSTNPKSLNYWNDIFKNRVLEMNYFFQKLPLFIY